MTGGVYPAVSDTAKPRRIVTALDEDGKTYIARVEEVPGGRSQGLPDEVRRRSYPKGVPDVRVVWDCDQLPAVLPADPEAEPSGRLPGPQGVRVSVTIFPPGWEGEMFWSNRVDAGGDLWVSNSFDRPLSEIDFEAEHRDPRPAGSLVRLRPDGRGEVVIDGMYMPNGLAIDPSEQWLYVLQTTLQTCVRLRLGSARPYLQDYGPPLGGGPDGMAFDVAGELVITIPDQHRLVALDRSGSLRTLAEDRDGTLLPFPTNCAFGGDGFRDLYVANMNSDHLPVIRHRRPGHPLYNRRDL